MVHRPVLLTVLCVACGALIAAPAASAGTITPNTTVDQLNAAGECSLREAVRFANDDATSGGCTDSANSAGDADTIVLAGGEYDLIRVGASDETNVNGDLDVTDDLTIQGAGAEVTGIDGNGSLTSDRVLDVAAFPAVALLTLSGLTVHDGATTQAGGAVEVSSSSDLTVVDSEISANTAGGSGGGISMILGSPGQATLINSTVTNNSAAGSGAGLKADS